MNSPKPVLAIMPSDWTPERVLAAEKAGYLPVLGDELCLTRILPDPNLYKDDQRAHFAGLAMAAAIAHPIMGRVFLDRSDEDGCEPEDVVAQYAVAHADALITELNKEKP